MVCACAALRARCGIRIPTEVRVGPSEGLPKVGVANADEIVTIPRTTLRDRIATLPRAKLDEIDAALRFALGLKA
jgi:mRNA-degrading endonuclease toxin of MazEF toxin-antitoxin module